MNGVIVARAEKLELQASCKHENQGYFSSTTVVYLGTLAAPFCMPHTPQSLGGPGTPQQAICMVRQWVWWGNGPVWNLDDVLDPHTRLRSPVRLWSSVSWEVSKTVTWGVFPRATAAVPARAAQQRVPPPLGSRQPACSDLIPRGSTPQCQDLYIYLFSF